MLDRYSDTAALSNNTNAADTPLLTNIGMTLLNCLNQMIGLLVPLINWNGSNQSVLASLVFGAEYCITCVS